MNATVSEKGQVAIPKPLRDRLGIQPGAVIDFEEERGVLVGRKVSTQDPIDALYGILAGAGPTDDLLAALRGTAGV
ncbi:MAG: AbrB/MazE/SpoVT family DNA-binding domain-containing protein [Chloroflexota bacterium]|nr:AbrB/MazE/SpoVT family DNA-binding domain-containing protein [Chloroflexota bacterium]